MESKAPEGTTFSDGITIIGLADNVSNDKLVRIKISDTKFATSIAKSIGTNRIYANKTGVIDLRDAAVGSDPEPYKVYDNETVIETIKIYAMDKKEDQKSQSESSEPAVSAPTATPTPTYISSGPHDKYPVAGNIRNISAGDSAFIYEQIRIKITDNKFATSIAKYSGSATPVMINSISADANGVINLLEASVGSETGAYRIYDGSTWTGGSILIWKPDLTLKAELAGSTDSVDGKAVSKSSSIHFTIQSPKVGGADIGSKVRILITTPVGGQTTMLGFVNLAEIPMDSVQHITADIPLSDTSLTAGTYVARAEWISPSSFNAFAPKSNTISFRIDSNTGLDITTNTESVVRNNPFTVTIRGNANTQYIVSLDSGKSPVPELIPGQVGVVRGDAEPKIVDTSGTTKTVQKPSSAADDPKSWGVATTDASGKRTVQYSTNPVNGKNVEDGTYTVRVNEIESRTTTAIAGTEYARINVKVVTGALSLTAGSDRNYYMGQEIKLTGTNTDSDTTYLFLTGPNLNSNGVSLDALKSGEFTKVSVKTDHTWEYKWDTAATGLDVGSYTVYAVSSMNDKTHLSGTKYATTSVLLKQPGMSTSSSTLSAAKGDDVHITGTVSGNPSSIAIFLFGTNYYQRVTTSVNDGTYDYKFHVPESMSSGEYYVVIEHPMYDGKFGVVEIHSDGKTILAQNSASGSTQSSFVVEGQGRLQGSQAANALIKMLDSPYIDDLYSSLKLIVAEPYISIDPVGDQLIGHSFTITGRTNMESGDQLLIEVAPTSFVPTGKNQQTAPSGVSGSVVIEKGSANNIWKFEVDGSRLALDAYTVKVSGVEVSTSTSASFNVIASMPETPTPLPTTTEVPTTPVTPTEAAKSPFGTVALLFGAAGALCLIGRRQ